MKQTSLVLTIVALLLSNIGGCSDSGSDISLPPVVGTAWRLEKIHIVGGETIVIPKHEIYTLYFVSESTTSGRIYCNTYQAKYRLENGRMISFADVSWTEMACPVPSSEREFSNALQNATSMTVVGNKFSLYYSGATRVLVFTRAN